MSRGMTGAFAIFVKTPGYSPVKTRLAAARGEPYAREWHLRAAHAVAAVATAAAASVGAQAYWAVAETAAVDDHAWTGLPLLGQGDGELGTRMASVHGELVSRHGCGILLGADAPQLDGAHLTQALHWLAADESRQVLGPARDGGFWLYGGNRAAATERWNRVGYSTPDTATQFAAAFADMGSWLRLPALTDVDRVEDLASMLDELSARPAPLPSQRALRDWMLDADRSAHKSGARW